MECIFYGDSDGSFFRYDDLSKCRKLQNAYLPLDMYEKRGINVPDVAPYERRILSVDVALMASRKHANDATAIAINVAVPTGNGSYISNFVYVETFEGLTTDELGLVIMRYFYHYKCTDLVLDSQGNGLGVYDTIIKPVYDPLTGETYDALTSCNNPEMAERCKIKNAKKCIWCIKASADFNSNAATSLRAGFRNGNINLLVNEFDCEDIIKKLPGYAKLSASEKAKLQNPYVQTSLLINEMINIEHEIVNNKVKLKEKSGMRKDRMSSIEYNYAVLQMITASLKPVQHISDLSQYISIRPPRRG